MLVKNAGSRSNVGLSRILATMRNGEFLTFYDTLEKLEVIRVDRNRVHGSDRKTYTLKESRDFLRKIREANWVFRFLDALRPRNRSARN